MPLAPALIEKIKQNSETRIIFNDPAFMLMAEDLPQLKKLFDANDHITEISIKEHKLKPGEYYNLLKFVESLPRIKILSCKLPISIQASLFYQSLGQILEQRRVPEEAKQFESIKFNSPR